MLTTLQQSLLRPVQVRNTALPACKRVQRARERSVDKLVIALASPHKIRYDGGYRPSLHLLQLRTKYTLARTYLVCFGSERK